MGAFERTFRALTAGFYAVRNGRARYVNFMYIFSVVGQERPHFVTGCSHVQKHVYSLHKFF